MFRGLSKAAASVREGDYLPFFFLRKSQGGKTAYSSGNSAQQTLQGTPDKKELSLACVLETEKPTELQIGTITHLLASGVPADIVDLLLADSPTEQDKEAQRIAIHGLFSGFLPNADRPNIARSVLAHLTALEVKRAADELVVFLSYRDSTKFLNFILGLWKNPNAADFEHGVFPALYYSVAHERLEEARTLIKHGADPLAEIYATGDSDEDIEAPWRRVFDDGFGIRDTTADMEELLRGAILRSGRVPPDTEPER